LEYTIPIKITGIDLKNPLLVASGFLGLSQSIFNRLYKLGAGAIVSKSISLLPREGYRNPTIIPINGNRYINAVGLANPGLEYFSKEISVNQIPLFVSIVGSTFEDFPEIVNKLKYLNILGFEGLNSFNRILRGLHKYLEIKNYKNITEMIGIAQRY
jgi:dihydroorotate dehydrogenase (NAD+) catalytic subunit